MNTCDKPLAMPGFISYRYKGAYGWIMIAAKDHDGAMRECARSTQAKLSIDNLQIWDSALGCYSSQLERAGHDY